MEEDDYKLIMSSGRRASGRTHCFLENLRDIYSEKSVEELREEMTKVKTQYDFFAFDSEIKGKIIEMITNMIEEKED